MANIICNTSPIQYLYQLDVLDILPALAGRIIVPRAVVDEIAAGRAAGVTLPDLTTLNGWIFARQPVSPLCHW